MYMMKDRKACRNKQSKLIGDFAEHKKEKQKKESKPDFLRLSFQTNNMIFKANSEGDKLIIFFFSFFPENRIPFSRKTMKNCWLLILLPSLLNIKKQHNYLFQNKDDQGQCI